MSDDLTSEHRAILVFMARLSPPRTTGSRVAENCNPGGESGWALARLTELNERGLVDDSDDGWYEISPAGLAAVAEA